MEKCLNTIKGFPLYQPDAADDSDFWEQSAMRLIRSSATLLEIAVRENLGEWRWTLGDLYKITFADTDMEKLRSDLAPLKNAGAFVEYEKQASIHRFEGFLGMPGKMQGSILGYAQRWFDNHR